MLPAHSPRNQIAPGAQTRCAVRMEVDGRVMAPNPMGRLAMMEMLARTATIVRPECASTLVQLRARGRVSFVMAPQLAETRRHRRHVTTTTCAPSTIIATAAAPASVEARPRAPHHASPAMALRAVPTRLPRRCATMVTPVPMATTATGPEHASAVAPSLARRLRVRPKRATARRLARSPTRLRRRPAATETRAPPTIAAMATEAASAAPTSAAARTQIARCPATSARRRAPRASAQTPLSVLMAISSALPQTHVSPTAAAARTRTARPG